MELASFLYDVAIPVLVGSGTALLILKYLAKKIIEQQLNKDIEEHKAELTEKVEGLKHMLSIYAHERNIQVSRVDSQMAEAIKSVYSSLTTLLKHAEIFANGKPKKVSALEEHERIDTQEAREYRFYKSSAESINSAAVALGDALLENSIFIEAEVLEKILSVQKGYLELSANFLQPIYDEECGRDDVEEIVGELLQNRDNLAAYYNDELVVLRDEIIGMLRKQLGVEKI